MNIISRYRFSLTAISLVVCPLVVSLVVLPEVIFGAEVQDSRSDLVVAQATGDRKAEADRLLDRGNDLSNVSRYREALQTWEKSLKIYREIKHLKGEGSVLNNLGSTYEKLGQYKKAISCYEQALVIFKQIGNPYRGALVLRNLGDLYENLGQYRKAFDFYQKALLLAKQIGDLDGEGGSLNGIGNVYRSLEQNEKAIDFYQKAFVIVNKTGKHIDKRAILHNLGIAYRKLGQYEKAIDFYQKSLVLAKQIGDLDGEGGVLTSLGVLYNNLGQYEKAIDFCQKALVISKQLGNLKGEADALNNLGVVYSRLEQHNKAIDFYQKSLVISKQIGDLKGEGNLLNNLGISFFKLNNLVSAEQTLRSGIQIWNSLRANSDNDLNKVSIFDSQTKTYQSLQQVLIARKQSNTALEIAESSRARSLVEVLANKLRNTDVGFGANRLDSRRLLIEIITGNTQPNLYLLPSNIAEIQQIAKAQKSTLVEYSIIYDDFNINGKQETKESELYIWVISPNGQITFRSVDLKTLWQKQNTSLDELVENSRKGIGVNDRDSVTIKIVLNPEYKQQLRQEQSKYLRQLHQILIEPIADLLPNDPNARVVFMPQSALYLVPFAALQDKSEQYLIQKHTIAISPSVQILSFTQQQRLALPTASARSSQNILVAGNPIMPKVFVPGIDQPLRLDDLQGAKQEAIAVANTLKTTALTGNQATKKAVVQQMQSARIIHLATHGLLDDFKGMGVPGAIALAPDGNGSNNDGLLTADEILGMKLKAELVVLSACNTGRGKITGDGVIGLSRSLISAGVPSIIVSLWSVPDAPTADLMSDFYSLLEQNSDKAQALRKAMLKTMKTHPDPRDWAAFTLIGES